VSPLSRKFLSALVGIVLYKAVAITFAPASSEFDYTTEALETIALAVVITIVFVLFDRWRGRREESVK